MAESSGADDGSRQRREPPKPPIDLSQTPDAPPADPDGEDHSPTRKIIVDDLTSIHAALERSGGELAISSFIFLVYDGLRLDVRRHLPIYTHLNNACWPYSYGDLRRDEDALNRALQRFAIANSLPFIDTAAEFPSDPDLFYDAIHLNEDGTRVHAWIVFQGLLPLVRERLASGAWPRPDQEPQQTHPCLIPPREYVVSCKPAPPPKKPKKEMRGPGSYF